MKAVRIKYKNKSGEYEMTGLLKKNASVSKLLEKYKKAYGEAEVVDNGEDY